VPDDRKLWKWTSLKLFTIFPTINSVVSIAGGLRRQQRHVFEFSLENPLPMTIRDVASELPHSNEGCKPTKDGTPRTKPARGLAVTVFKVGSPTELQRHSMTGV
jgi:hypothetical protein